MGYADDTVDVSQSPEQLRKFMLVIVVVRAAFGLPVSNTKTEKKLPLHSALRQIVSCTNTRRRTRVYRALPAHRISWSSFWKYTLEIYDRPSAPLRLIIRRLKAEALEAMLYGCTTIRLSPRYAAPRTPHPLGSVYLVANANLTDHPVSYLYILVMTESESIEVTLRKMHILFAE